MMKRLPPMAAIEAFVAAARLGSVKAAAEALALSSPALTRRIQTLERHVGVALFERGHQAVRLNAEGARLIAELGPALDAVARALGHAAAADGRLRLGVPPLFATYRLLPRLAELRRRHPDLHVDLDTGPGAVARLDDDLDAAVVLAPSVDRALYSRRLPMGGVVAIAAPDLAARLAGPADLAGLDVLIHRDLPDAFDVWRKAAGCPDLKPASIDEYDSGQLILGSAAQGLGVAFMLELHLAGAHDEGLVRLFDIVAESAYSYWFACHRPALERRAVRLFHDWLVEARPQDRLHDRLHDRL
jgi:LysR family glycine cleavage system transcriptional activator